MLIKTSELLRWDTVVIMLFQTCLYLHGLGPYFKDYLSLHFSARALRLPGDAFSGARAHLRPDWWWPGRGFVSDQPHRRPKEWPQRSTQISRWPPPPPSLAAGGPSSKVSQPQTIQMETGGEQIDDNTFLTLLYKRLGGIPLGHPSPPPSQPSPKPHWWRSLTWMPPAKQASRLTARKTEPWYGWWGEGLKALAAQG